MRSVIILLLVAVPFLAGGVAAAQNGAVETAATSGDSAPLAVVESATYSARFNGTDLVAGEASFEVVKRGEGPPLLDWTDIRVPLGKLRWEDGDDAVWGTAPDQRRLLVMDRQSGTLRGRWSLHGQQVEDRVMFDAVLPQALRSTLSLELPEGWSAVSSQGIVSRPERSAGEPDDSSVQRWRIDLGRHQSTTLSIFPDSSGGSRTRARCEVETVHVARHDGIFMQSNITLERQQGLPQVVRLHVPKTLTVQSVSVSGVHLAYQRPADEPDRLLVSLNSSPADQRVTLRIRGFQPARWDRKRILPRIRVLDAHETRRNSRVSVEPPLQVREFETDGFIQTGLSQEGPSEVWQFESRKPNARLFVDIGLPKSEVLAEMICLGNFRRRSAWVATRLNLRADEGADYVTVLRLPSDWELVSVAPADSESQIASWNVRDQILTISYQNPMTPTSRRSLDLFARCESITPGSAGFLTIPAISDASEVSVRYQAIVPPEQTLEILEGDGWQLTEHVELEDVFQQSGHITGLLAEARSLNLIGLRSTSRSVSVRTAVQFVKRPPLEESTSQSLMEGPAGAETGPGSTQSPALASRRMPATAGHLKLSTTAGRSEGRQLVHHAEIAFNGPVPTPELHLRLPESCRISAVSVDGQAVTVFREDDAVRFPAEIPEISELSLTYVTSGEGEGLSQDNEVPVPHSALPIAEFAWTLHLPADHRLARLGLPGVAAALGPAGEEGKRLFGPLARSGQQRLFQPFSLAAWRELFGFEREPAPLSATERQTFRVHAPAVGEIVRFTTWDIVRARNYAWVALLACLLLGTGARLFDVSFIRRIAIIWLALLVLLLSVVSLAWSMILGGMLVGSLLSMLLPRRLIQQRDFLVFLKRSLRPRLPRVAAGGLLLGLSLTLAGDANSSSPTDPAPRGTDLPPFLIRSAEYELLESSGDTPLRATFRVLVREDLKEKLIRLPFQNVVFRSGAECLVDGVLHPLIPSVSGDAVVIPLKGSPDAAEPLALDVRPDSWTLHEVKLDLVVRGERGGSDEDPSSGAARIPAVLDSTLLAPGPLPSPALRRWGEKQVLGDDSVRIQLGAVGQLGRADSGNSAERGPVSAVSLLEVSPLRIRGQTQLAFGNRPRPGQITLRYPPATVISAVSSSGVQDWFETVGEEGETLLALRLKPGERGQTLSINFELTQLDFADGTLGIPAIPLVSAWAIPHAIGLAIPVGMTAEIGGLSGTAGISLEEWSSLADFGRTRPSVAVRLPEPRSFAVNLSVLTPQTSAKISETLNVQRDRLSWTATVQTNVTQVPTFQHRFRIDPALKIESVRTGEEGGGGAVRFVQEDEWITLFLSGGQLGESTFTLTGSKPFLADAWRTVPAFEVAGAATTESQLTIQDATFWNIEMQTAAGTTVRSPVTDGAGGAGEEWRTIGPFRRGSAGRPTMLRAVPPPHATRVDSVVFLQTPEEGDWSLVHTFHFSATDVPLRKVTFSVPEEFSSVRVRPTHFRHTILNQEQGTVITVQIPERFSDAATVTLLTPLPPEVHRQLENGSSAEATPSFPAIRATSAQRATQFILLDARAPVSLAPTSSMRVSGVGLPNWVPVEWHRGVRRGELNCFQQIRPQFELVRKTPEAGAETARITLDETILWPLDDGSLRGLTRVWLVTNDATRFRVSHPPEVSIRLVTSDSRGAVGYTLEEQGCTIDLEKQETVTSLVLHWSSRSEAPSPLRLLEFPETPSDRHLVAVVAPRGRTVQSGPAARLSRLEAWLFRWDALLEGLTELSASLSVDGSLLRQIRLCQERAAELIETSQVTPGQRERFQSLAEKWQQRQRELVISVDDIGEGTSFGTISIGTLLNVEDQAEAVLWLVPESNEWTGRASERRLSRWSWQFFFGSLFLFGAFALVFRVPDRFGELRELVAEFPGGCTAVLGLFWWLFLAPSLFGLLLFLGGGLYEWLRRDSRLRREESLRNVGAAPIRRTR